MIPLALLQTQVYTGQLGQSSVVACDPWRVGRFYHGD